jgi:hypothetical protein
MSTSILDVVLPLSSLPTMPSPTSVSVSGYGRRVQTLENLSRKRRMYSEKKNRLKKRIITFENLLLTTFDSPKQQNICKKYYLDLSFLFAFHAAD